MGFYARELPFAVLGRLLGSRVVIHMHGGDVKGFLGGRMACRLLRWITKSGKVVALTDEVGRAASIALGMEKVITIGNPAERVDITRRGRRANRHTHITALHVGNQTEAKGTFDLIEVSRYYPDIHFRFVGPISAFTREHLTRVSVPGNCAFLGVKTGAALQEEYNQATIFVLPSHEEGAPLALLEALATGLPCVVTNVGSMPDMISLGGKRAGTVVPFLHAPAPARQRIERLGEALAKTVASPENLRDMEVLADEIARLKHSPQKVFAELARAFEASEGLR